MAMLTKNMDIVQLGNRSDVCVLCARKAKIRYAEARRELKGKLEGKKVLRPTGDTCYCIECLKELVESVENATDEGVNI